MQIDTNSNSYTNLYDTQKVQQTKQTTGAATPDKTAVSVNDGTQTATAASGSTSTQSTKNSTQELEQTIKELQEQLTKIRQQIAQTQKSDDAFSRQMLQYLTSQQADIQAQTLSLQAQILSSSSAQTL
ncbi:hypothetical protein [Campylobacter curvus]|uniref:hypothetical protein n=1 Tax=Campylobacter curvus TaxID=200 RepID=UPI000373B4F0|nr:hypothetical protein [Campylobacter curvus]QKF60860.1 hypothetical protein CCVT_0548 [Campylobacter curvus]UEB49181.1 hypothetical protein LK426_05995 [Campylobacter curvus]